MSKSNRQQEILEHLEQHGSKSYRDLVQSFQVSAMTIRRDIDQMADRGEVLKTPGGVQIATSASDLHESALESRMSQQAPQKRAIALRALELVCENDTIYLDGATTCLELAKLIAGHCKQVTVLTNSLLISLELCRSNENSVILLGGLCDSNSLSIVGDECESALADYHVDLAFISTKGFSPREGTFESHIPTMRVKQIVAERCKRMVLLIDSTKFSQHGLCKVLDNSQIQTVITDDGVSAEDMNQMDEQGIETLLVQLSQPAESVSS